MDRRDSLIALGALGLAGATPRTLSQGTKAGQPRRIAVLEFGSRPNLPNEQLPWSVAIRKLGWVEGENVVVERAYANFNIERLPALAEGLARKRPEVIWTGGNQVAIAAGRASQTIPIVFFNASWPVEIGLVDSLARPGRNLTGTTLFAEVGLSTKRLEFLREIVPAVKRLSRLGEPSLNETLSGGSFDIGAIWDSSAERLGFITRLHEIRKVEDVDPALAQIVSWGAEAMNGTGGTYLFPARQRIADFALHHRLPSVFAIAPIVEAGGLLSYGPAPEEGAILLTRSLEYVDRILRGARPSELPVQSPRKYELLINMKTAKALGLKIPQSVLVRADRLIE